MSGINDDDDRDDDARDGASKHAVGSCPICSDSTDPDYRPFCSKRCADIDLGRWLGERYVVPDRAVVDDDDWSSDHVTDQDMDPDPRRLN